MRTNTTSRSKTRAYLPVPAPMRPLAGKLAAARIEVNVDRAMATVNSPDGDQAGKAARLLAKMDADGCVSMGPLGMTTRTRRLVEVSDSLSACTGEVLIDLLPGDGHRWLRIEPYANPLFAAAYVAGDAALTQALYGDPYQTVADRIGGNVTRVQAKEYLFRYLFAPDRVDASSVDVAAGVDRVLPDLSAYVKQARAADPQLVHVQQLAGDVVNDALVALVDLLDGLAEPVFLEYGSDLLCRVRNDNWVATIAALDWHKTMMFRGVRIPVSWERHRA